MEILPPKLQVGDTVRFVSPASTPDRERVLLAAEVLENWGLKVESGENAFRKHGYLAGTDAERLADFNAALRDPNVRAIIATRGGKGSYRIADRLDFDAATRDPKFVVGFSDIPSSRPLERLRIDWRPRSALPGRRGADCRGNKLFTAADIDGPRKSGHLVERRRAYIRSDD